MFVLIDNRRVNLNNVFAIHHLMKESFNSKMTSSNYVLIMNGDQAVLMTVKVETEAMMMMMIMMMMVMMIVTMIIIMMMTK